MKGDAAEELWRRAPPLLGRRGVLLLSLIALGVAAAFALGLRPHDFVPGGSSSAGSFFASAFRPAWSYEGSAVPEGATPFLVEVLYSLTRTVGLALVAMSLAVPLGVLLGLLAAKNPARENDEREGLFSRTVRGLARGVAALLRSVHELLWAVLFLAALGLGSGPAVLALALPYAGILAKIFAELIEEASPAPARGLRAAGAGRLHVFFAATLPTALPDMAAYAFYRLECAVRSAAVLGFFGLPTLGMRLQASFESRHYREVWTELYALFLLVLLFEAWSGRLRRESTQARKSSKATGLQALYRARPKSRFLRGTILALVICAGLAWLQESGELFASLFDERRVANFQRFVTVDLVPPAVRDGELSLASWLGLRWSTSGARALGTTVALAFAALSLAVLSSFPLVFSAAKTLVPSRWLRGAARLVCVFLRAIPELFWAFLFVGLFGAGALPAVLALALHNAGILGRLGADLAENLDPGPRGALEQAGASRAQTAVVAVTPEGLPRYLTFVFYRLETCVRESTVLGFVGVVSLGWFVEDARARGRYDLVLYFIALGAIVVLLADLSSTLVRRWIRNA